MKVMIEEKKNNLEKVATLTKEKREAVSEKAAAEIKLGEMRLSV
jgi:hypothetical protein